jgi:cation diffusion facilitator family transporter
MWSKKEKVAALSVIASGSLAAAKFVVGVVIGSLALISDALHSLIDLGATLVTWFAVRVADRPPDAEHHYGHGKVESLAALAATALVLRSKRCSGSFTAASRRFFRWCRSPCSASKSW